jgi:hypothetical protein
MTDVQVQTSNGNHQNMAELGARVGRAGYTVMETRALIAMIQEVAAQTAMNVAPHILEKVGDIHAARIRELSERVERMPTTFGHVPKDLVLSLIRNVTAAQ